MDAPHIFFGQKQDVAIPNVTLGRLFYDSLRSKEPSEVIVVEYSTGKCITREELLQKSIRLAVVLQNLGIKSGDVLAIISKNTWKYLVSIISAFFIGATVSNVNHYASKDELHHYLTLSEPKVVFTPRDAVGKIRTLRKALPSIEYVITFDEEERNGEILFEHFVNCAYVDYASFHVQDEDVGSEIILFSSGTTGLPKAVMLTQENLKVGLKFVSGPNTINVHGQSIVGILPMFHMFGLFVSLGCVLYGRKNVIMDKFKPDLFLRAIEEHKVTCLFVVPPLALFLAKHPLIENYDLSSVKDIFSGAAPLGEEVQSELSKRLGVNVRQIYGSTEIGGLSCTPPGVQKSGSVGKLAGECQVKIIDSSGKTLGRNSVGEICYKGPGLMKGYKGNEQATKDDMDDDGFLHLGDVGYFDDEEYLYIVGRIKDIIKYKGFQIYGVTGFNRMQEIIIKKLSQCEDSYSAPSVPPAQLESVLNKHPGIKDAAVTGKRDEIANELPTALVVRQDNSKVTEQEIIDYVAERVSPEKRLRGGVIFVNEIPRTNTGKILRNKLIEFL